MPSCSSARALCDFTKARAACHTPGEPIYVSRHVGAAVEALGGPRDVCLLGAGGRRAVPLVHAVLGRLAAAAAHLAEVSLTLDSKGASGSFCDITMLTL